MYTVIRLFFAMTSAVCCQFQDVIFMQISLYVAALHMYNEIINAQKSEQKNLFDILSHSQNTQRQNKVQNIEVN
jgi:hypothetical protein